MFLQSADARQEWHGCVDGVQISQCSFLRTSARLDGALVNSKVPFSVFCDSKIVRLLLPREAATHSFPANSKADLKTSTSFLLQPSTFFPHSPQPPFSHFQPTTHNHVLRRHNSSHGDVLPRGRCRLGRQPRAMHEVDEQPDKLPQQFRRSQVRFCFLSRRRQRYRPIRVRQAKVRDAAMYSQPICLRHISTRLAHRQAL